MASDARVTHWLPQLSPEQSTLAWIQYQRFSRRSESVQSSRKIFMRARKAPGSQWHVFAASALMEWHAAKNETVSLRIMPYTLILNVSIEMQAARMRDWVTVQAVAHTFKWMVRNRARF